MTWGGEDLAALSAETTLRLRFVFGNAGGNAPRLYRWEVEDAPTAVVGEQVFSPLGPSIIGRAQ